MPIPCDHSVPSLYSTSATAQLITRDSLIGTGTVARNTIFLDSLGDSCRLYVKGSIPFEYAIKAFVFIRAGLTCRLPRPPMKIVVSLTLLVLLFVSVKRKNCPRDDNSLWVHCEMCTGGGLFEPPSPEQPVIIIVARSAQPVRRPVCPAVNALAQLDATEPRKSFVLSCSCFVNKLRIAIHLALVIQYLSSCNNAVPG